MKIGIFTNNYLPNPYGVSSSIESFRKEFEALGNEVFIFAPAWKGYVDKNPHVFRYPALDIEFKFKFPLGIPYSQKMDKILEKLELDIIHSQHPNLLGTAAAKWARKKNIPLVFTWHTLYDRYAHFAVIIPEKIAAWWTIRNARNYANLCDQVIVPSGSARKIIEHWGVKNNNTDVIPTGVDETFFAGAEGGEIRKKYGIADDEILLVVITRLTEEKNMKFLIEAGVDILKSNPKVKFLVGGEGYLENELKEISKDVQDRIIFAGFVPNEIKKDYYAAGDIFIFASKSETQGMIINEAMYAGLPIVAVCATGVEDSVVDGQTGFLVAEDRKKFSGAVEKLFADQNLRRQFGVAAQKIAREKYTAQVCAQKMLRVFEKAIKLKVSN